MVYYIGRKVMVCAGEEEIPDGYYEDGEPKFEYRPTWAIKTCLGCRLFHAKDDYGSDEAYRIVYFDDGTSWNEDEEPSRAPRLIEDDPFLRNAFNHFVNFMNGDEPKVELHSPAGEVITFRRRTEVLPLL